METNLYYIEYLMNGDKVLSTFPQSTEYDVIDFINRHSHNQRFSVLAIYKTLETGNIMEMTLRYVEGRIGLYHHLK